VLGDSATEPGLHIVDVSNPAKPVRLGRIEIEGEGGSKVFLYDNLAFVSSGLLGILAVDITNPRAPALKAKISASPAIIPGISYLYNNFAAADGLLVCGDGKGLNFYDLNATDLTKPAGHLNLDAGHLTVQRGLVKAIYGNRLCAIDARNPAAPVLMTSTSLAYNGRDSYAGNSISCYASNDGYHYAGFVSPYTNVLGLCVYTSPVSVLSPTGAATLRSGSRIDVRWRTDLPRAGNAVWLELWDSKGYVASLGHDWNPAGEATKSVCLPLVPDGSDYRIRATSRWDPAFYGESELPFTIRGGAVRLDSPDRATWPLNTLQAIAWQSSPKVAGTAVRFELWRGGRKVKDLGYGWNPAGRATTLVWVAGVPAASDYRLRVVSTWNPQWWDESAGVIAIQNGK
jgi:hypothetical protein